MLFLNKKYYTGFKKNGRYVERMALAKAKSQVFLKTVIYNISGLQPAKDKGKVRTNKLPRSDCQVPFGYYLRLLINMLH